MAQNVVINGVTYSAVPSVAIPKVGGGNAHFYDVAGADIKANTEEIKTEQKEQRKVNTEVITRLTAVEESTKQAHKRLDTFEHRIGREE